MPESGLPPTVTGAVVTVGTFDGVHLGHRDLIDRVVVRSRVRGLPAVLVTFEPHPLEIVNPSAAPPLLTTWEEKLELLAESGVDYAAILPFTPALAAYDAELFVQRLLRRRFRMAELLIGYDHGFGRAREGDADVLRTIGARDGFRVEVIDAVRSADGRPISSTGIRRAVAGGDLSRAAAGLGRPYSIGGVVVRGAGRGKTLGYPTLNLSVSPRKLLPPEGVYAVRAQTTSGSFGGMLNLGPRPTFGDTSVGIEVYLLDAAGDFYGSRVRIELVQRLRDVRAFPSPAALVAEIRKDEAAARAALTVVRGSGNLRPQPSCPSGTVSL